MLVNIEICDYSTSFDVALIQWYDFIYKNDIRRLYKYDCPFLKLLNSYNFVPIESIYEIVHIVPRADQENQYFVNMFMF